jgi:hypothetical protein
LQKEDGLDKIYLEFILKNLKHLAKIIIKKQFYIGNNNNAAKKKSVTAPQMKFSKEK